MILESHWKTAVDFIRGQDQVSPRRYKANILGKRYAPLEALLFSSSPEDPVMPMTMLAKPVWVDNHGFGHTLPIDNCLEGIQIPLDCKIVTSQFVENLWGIVFNYYSGFDKSRVIRQVNIQFLQDLVVHSGCSALGTGLGARKLNIRERFGIPPGLKFEFQEHDGIYSYTSRIAGEVECVVALDVYGENTIRFTPYHKGGITGGPGTAKSLIYNVDTLSFTGEDFVRFKGLSSQDLEEGESLNV